MPMPGSAYWNIVYGRNIGEAEQDAEGMQTMCNLAKNMVWMLKCFDLGNNKGKLTCDKSSVLICSPYGRQWKYPKIYHMRSIFLCLGNSIVRS